MAIYNEILSGRYNRALQKIFAVKGHAPVRQISGEIMPTHSMFSGVENRYTEAWERFASLISVAAGGAGALGQVRLRNPAGSNVICVLEKAFIVSRLSNDTMDLYGGPMTTDLAVIPTFQAGIRLDSRGRPGSGAGAVLVWSSTTNAALQGGPGFAQRLRVQTTGGGPPIEPIGEDDGQHWPILPGDAVQFNDVIGNLDFTVSCVWRERPLEESERF